MSAKYETENNRDVSTAVFDDRYDAYTTDSDTVVVFDAENPTAWIESDEGVSLLSRT